MNLEKFTDRAKGFLQAAQTVAIRNNHQRIAPEHLLKALIEDDQGMASGLIQAAGGDPKRVERETDAALAKIPAVSGSGAQSSPGLDNDLVRVLDQAEQVAQKAGDSFVTVERMLLALALASTTAAGELLAEAIARGGALDAPWARYGLAPVFGRLGLLGAQAQYSWAELKDAFHEALGGPSLH